MNPSYFEQAVAHHGAGEGDAAEHMYRKAIENNDQRESAAYNLALLYAVTNRPKEAQPLLCDLIDQNPNDAAAHAMLGKILLDEQEYVEARLHLDLAVKFEPTNINPILSLTDCMLLERQFIEAIALLDNWLLTPGMDVSSRYLAMHKMGEVLTAQGNENYDLELYEKAKQAYLQGIKDQPNFLPALINLVRVHSKLGEFEEAQKLADKAISLSHEDSVTWMTKASALSGLDEGKERNAIDAYRRVLEMEPEHTSAHWNLSQSLLRLEQYEEGWREYRWRVRRGHDDFQIPEGPAWKGEKIDGPLVVYTEQGYGDAIQFARFLPLTKERAESIIVACQPRLMDLFGRIDGNYLVCARDNQLDNAIPKVSIMDLPDVFGVTADTIAMSHPYLIARESTLDKFHFLRESPAPRIGFVWAGNSFPDPLRTCSLKHFVDLSVSQDIVLNSLLVGPESNEITDELSEFICDLSGLQDGFDDAASAIMELDLIITVDTAIAHLAGALGRETWLLLPYRADWRWPLAGDTTSWYPSLRLFKQHAFNDWPDVFSRIDAELTAWRKLRGQ